MVPPIRILGEYDTFTSRIASSVSGYRCHTWRSCAKAILTPGVATAQDAAGTGWRRQNRRDSRFRRNRLSADIQCAWSVCRRDGAANDWAGSDPIFCGLIRWGPAIRTFCIFDGAAGWEILPNRTYALLRTLFFPVFLSSYPALVRSPTGIPSVGLESAPKMSTRS
jgi:hypothetical protein